MASRTRKHADMWLAACEAYGLDPDDEATLHAVVEPRAPKAEEGDSEQEQPSEAQRVLGAVRRLAAAGDAAARQILSES